MNVNEYFSRVHEPVMARLSEMFHALVKLCPQPTFRSIDDHMHWRYDSPSVEHICLMYAARILSGFNAIRHLLLHGHVQETAVLLRTINEFQENIMFLLEKLPSNEIGAQQQQFIAEFLKDEDYTTNKPIERIPPIRKKVKASVARFVSPVINPSDSQCVSQDESDFMSQYVHGSYPTIMEMYGGAPPESRFYIEGMLDTPRVAEWLRCTAMSLERTVPIFVFICKFMSQDKYFNELLQIKNWFLQALANMGITVTESPVEIMSKIKAKRNKRS